MYKSGIGIGIFVGNGFINKRILSKKSRQLPFLFYTDTVRIYSIRNNVNIVLFIVFTIVFIVIYNPGLSDASRLVSVKKRERGETKDLID